MLQNLYVDHRSKVKSLRNENKKHIPITVRQLEAIIRLSESLAKMRLSPVVEKEDVEEANRIFEVSTMESLKSNVGVAVDPNKNSIIIQIEDQINKLLPVNQRILLDSLTKDLENKFKDMQAVQDAIGYMIGKG